MQGLVESLDSYECEELTAGRRPKLSKAWAQEKPCPSLIPAPPAPPRELWSVTGTKGKGTGLLRSHIVQSLLRTSWHLQATWRPSAKRSLRKG